VRSSVDEKRVSCVSARYNSEYAVRSHETWARDKTGEVEDRACRGGSENAAVYVDRDREPKGPRFSGIECSKTATHALAVRGHRPSYERLSTGIHPEVDRPRREKGVEYPKKKALVSSLPPPRYTPSVWTRIDDCVNAEGRIGDKSWLVTIETGAPVTVASPDITAGLPERDLTTPEVLQMESGEILS
jgi:hypothetical protein